MLAKSVDDTFTIGFGSIPVKVIVYPFKSAAATPEPPVPEVKSRSVGLTDSPILWGRLSRFNDCDNSIFAK
jgi:hypothetical protein